MDTITPFDQPKPLCAVCGGERIGAELEHRTCGDCGGRWRHGR